MAKVNFTRNEKILSDALGKTTYELFKLRALANATANATAEHSAHDEIEDMVESSAEAHLLAIMTAEHISALIDSINKAESKCFLKGGAA